MIVQGPSCRSLTGPKRPVPKCPVPKRRAPIVLLRIWSDVYSKSSISSRRLSKKDRQCMRKHLEDKARNTAVSVKNSGDRFWILGGFLLILGIYFMQF